MICQNWIDSALILDLQRSNEPSRFSFSHLAMMKGVDLLEDPSPTVSRHLLDDLDSVLNVGVDVDTGLDAGVGSFSQHLPRQFVKLLRD